MELTGSKEVTEENLNMSLLTAYCDKIIPEMEAEHVRLSEVGRYKVVAVCQEDGSRPHCYKVYKKDISKEFFRVTV